jgi:hypothetical protein
MPDAAERYAEAFRALCRNSIAEYAAGVIGETDEYLRVNRAMASARAERGVPWWRRWLIERRILRELDYWKHTGGWG